jgi:hypothetical protein
MGSDVDVATLSVSFAPVLITLAPAPLLASPQSA